MGFETWTPSSNWIDVVGRTVADSQDNLHKQIVIAGLKELTRI
jgi:hypothetical protein